MVVHGSSGWGYSLCGVLWRGVLWRGVVWCGVVWCGVWCGAVWCGVVRCGVAWCDVVWCVVQYRTLRVNIACRPCLVRQQDSGQEAELHWSSPPLSLSQCVVWRGVVWCGVVWCVVQYRTLRVNIACLPCLVRQQDSGQEAELHWSSPPLSFSQCVVWCGVAWCGVVWCGVVWRGTGHQGLILPAGPAWSDSRTADKKQSYTGPHHLSPLVNVWCGVVWRGVVWCGVAWYRTSRVNIACRPCLVRQQDSGQEAELHWSSPPLSLCQCVV